MYLTLSSKLSGECSGDFLLFIFSYHAHRGPGRGTFDTHIWMLQTLLQRSSGLQDLQLYVIAASFPKMLFRMNNRRIAKHYFECFRKLESMDFEFVEHPSTATTGSNSKHPDRLLFDAINALAGTTDRIPNLTQMAKDMQKTPREIYNKDTYMEFHWLLCSMLNRFHQSLTTLKNLHEQRETPDSKILDLKSLGDIKDILNFIMVHGRCLRAIVRSAAVEKHLKTIAHLLEVDDEKLGMPSREDEIELHVLKPYSMYQGQPLLPWQSYRDWLRLTVLYFDATVILRDHVHSLLLSHIDIDIKILSPRLPDEDQKMLPWKVLLRHKLYFPELPNAPEQPSAEALISFLTSDFNVVAVTEGTGNQREEGNSIKGKKGKGTLLEKTKSVSIEQVIESVMSLKEKQESAIAVEGVNIDGWTKAVDSVIDQMTLVKNCSSPGGDEYTTAIFEQLKTLKNNDLTPQYRLSRTREILDMFEALRGHSLLYQMLKEGTALSRGDRFGGTRHCEVCIASLLAEPGPDDSQFGEIRRDFRVSHIFILCLNVHKSLQHRNVDQL